MARNAPTITCGPEDRQELERWPEVGPNLNRVIERAQIILGCLAGKRVQEVAACLSHPSQHRHQVAATLCPTRAGRTGGRAAAGSQAALWRGLPQPGAGAFGTAAPAGQACWDGPAVAAALKGSVHAVWRVLRHEGICLQRQRSWCVSTDKEFAVKAADIVGLYLNPPEKALVISVDEKPSIQALERKTGYVETDNGKIVRGLKSTYKRHGTLNLFAALEVATGQVKTAITQLKRREEFLQFMDQVVAESPAEQELHVILDNYCTHKKCDALAAPASKRSLSLHADLGQLAQPGGNLVWNSLAQSTARIQRHKHRPIAAGD